MDLTERVDNAFILLLNVLEATDPLSAVPHGSDSGGPVRALESWNEEVPCSPEDRQGGATGNESPESVSPGPRVRM